MEKAYPSRDGKSLEFDHPNRFNTMLIFQSMRLEASCWPVDPAVFAPADVFDRVMKANVVARLFILP